MAPEWDALLAASAADTPFLTRAWLDAWWTAYGDRRQPFIVLARREGTLVGVLPLQIGNVRWRGGLNLRAIRLLGDGTHDSDYLDFIVRRGDEEAVLVEFWSWLHSGASTVRYAVAHLNEIPGSSPSAATLRRLAQRHGTLLDETRVGCVIAPLPDSYEAYVASLKPRMRTKVRSLRRNLEEAHGATVVRCDDEASLAPTLESLFRLHGMRWAGRGEAGVFGTPEKRRFYQAMARSLQARGWLDLTTLLAGGVPVAHQLCIRYKGTAYLLQEGYDPAWEDRGVGNVLRAMTLERMIQEGVRAYDFLAGVTSHKLSWGGTVKESLRFTLRGSGPYAALATGMTRLAAARARIRALMTRSGT